MRKIHKGAMCAIAALVAAFIVIMLVRVYYPSQRQEPRLPQDIAAGPQPPAREEQTEEPLTTQDAFEEEITELLEDARVPANSGFPPEVLLSTTVSGPVPGWRPVAKRNTSPETAAEIERIINDAIISLGYDKVKSLKLTRVETGDLVSGGRVRTSHESYVNPDLVIRDRVTMLGDNFESRVIEEVREGLVTQKIWWESPDSSPEVETFENPWENHVNHPLMLHHELNPLTYEALEVKRLSDEEAVAVGAKDAAGHRIAILKPPRLLLVSGDTLGFETWLDLDTGRVLSNTIYVNGKPSLEKRNFVYKEISEGVFYPVAYTQTFSPGSTSQTVSEVEVVDIEVNIPIDQEPPAE